VFQIQVVAYSSTFLYKGLLDAKEGKVGNDKTLNTIVIVIIEQYEKYVKICHDDKVKINHKL
jgi:hypothetical protein